MLIEFLIFLLIVAWIIAGYYITRTSLNLGPFSVNGSMSKDGDSFLQKAYTYSTWAAVLTWLILALIIIVIIFAIIGVVALFSTGVGEVAVAYQTAGGDVVGTVSSGLSWLTLIFLFIVLVLIITTAVLSSLAFINIAESPLYNKNKQVTQAHDFGLISMVITFGSLFLLILGFLFYYLLSGSSQSIASPQYLPSDTEYYSQ